MTKSVLEKDDLGSKAAHSLEQKETRGAKVLRKLLRWHRLT